MDHGKSCGNLYSILLCRFIWEICGREKVNKKAVKKRDNIKTAMSSILLQIRDILIALTDLATERNMAFLTFGGKDLE